MICSSVSLKIRLTDSRNLKDKLWWWLQLISLDDVPHCLDFWEKSKADQQFSWFPWKQDFNLWIKIAWGPKMPNRDYKNIFPQWDSHNKRLIVKQNRNNKFTRDSFFIIHTIFPFCIVHIYLVSTQLYLNISLDAVSINTFSFFCLFFTIFNLLKSRMCLYLKKTCQWLNLVQHLTPPQDVDIKLWCFREIAIYIFTVFPSKKHYQ